MPIYEYYGQHYDIPTEDQEVAKNTILAHLGQAAPAVPVASAAGAPNLLAPPAPIAPPAPVPEAKAEPKPKPYTSRIDALDDAVNLLEEGVDKEELRPAFEKMGLKWDEITAHGVKRGSDYFKARAPTTKPTAPAVAGAEPSGRLSATPEKGSGEQFVNVFKRAKSNYEDVATAYLTQAGVINPSDAGRLISQTAKRRYNAAPTQETQEGMMAIGNAETLGGAVTEMAKNPGATLSMLTDSLMLSLPAAVPAMVLGPAGAVASGVAGGLSSFGLEYGSAMADVLQSRGVDLLNAEEVANALSNPKIMAQIKEQGLKRGVPIGVIDGLTMGLAGRFLKPARALIAEGKLTGTAAKKATIAAWAKELGMQTAGGAGGEAIAQVAAKQEYKPADIALEAVAGGVSAPIEVVSNLRGSAELERQAALGNLPTTVPGERIEPTLEATPNAQNTPIPPTASEAEAPSYGGDVGEPTGASVPVAGEPGLTAPAEGIAGVEPDGVVPSAEVAGGTAAGKGNVPTAVEPVVTRNSPPEDPTQLWAPTVTLDYGNYTIENDAASIIYGFKAPAKISPTASITGMAVASDRTTLLAVNKNGQEVLVRIYPDHIRLDKVTGMGFKDHNFGSGVQTPDVNKIFGKKLVDMLESLPAEERVDAATRAIAEKLGVANLDRFVEEYDAMQSGKPLEQPTTTEETQSGTETPEAQQAEAQGQAEPAVPATAATAAEQVAPQEVSVNEDEVRASAAPPPGGRVEPYLLRSAELPDPAQVAETLEVEGIGATEKLRKSRLAEEGPDLAEALRARDPKAVLSILRQLVARNWQNMSYGAISKVVTQPTFTFLADWSGVKALDDAAIQLQKMHGFSQSLLADAHVVLDELQKKLNPLFTNPEAYRKKFEDLVYGATLTRYDPSDPASTPLKGRSAVDIAEARKLDAAYKSVGPKGQEMYKNLKAYYERMIQLYSDLLDEQINQLPGMSSEAKENLINVLRKTFEADARIRPFFPLVRRGDFFLRVTEMRGKDLHEQFYMFESIADRETARVNLLNDNPNAEMSSGEGISQLRIKTYKTSEMLTKIFDEIDKEDFGAEQSEGAAKEALKDAIYQVYLNTMPEQSFRNQFVHRKDRTGFSTDLLRNVATTASRTSMQLARLKYSPLLRNSLSAARDAVEGRPNLSPFVIEAEKRVNMALSGEGGGLGDAIAGVANKASYFWFLSGASSALIQPFSVYISGLPVLAANHNNVSGAAKELAKVSKLIGQFGVIRTNKDGTQSYVSPSIANNKDLTDNERDAIDQMTARGVSQSTYANLVYGERDVVTRTSSTVLGKAGYIGAEGARLLTSSLMHNIERMTREGVYLASYRLGVKRGLDHDAAINQAVKDVNEALGNYDISNRPRWTQRGLGKMVFQFKMFPLHTTLLLLTNFAKMMPFLNKEGKKAAATKFFGIYLTAGSIAGLSGIPFFSSSLGAIATAFKAMQEEDDWPDELKDIDAKTWFREVFLPEHLGAVSIGGIPVSQILDAGPLNALTGYAIAERIGLSDLFGRDMKEMKTAREGVAQVVMELAGPSAGLVLAFADAYDAYQVGDIQKMQERLAPAVLRNILVASKIADEGIMDAAGNPIVAPEDVSTGMLAAQAVGFRTATASKVSDVGAKLKGDVQKIVNQKTLIENRIKVQARKGTDESFDKMVDIIDSEVTKFNSKYPSHRMTIGGIREMVTNDLKVRAQSRLGISREVVKKNIDIVGDVLDNLEARVDREEAAREAAKKQ
jgi:hypothetical protein